MEEHFQFWHWCRLLLFLGFWNQKTILDCYDNNIVHTWYRIIYGFVSVAEEAELDGGGEAVAVVHEIGLFDILHDKVGRQEDGRVADEIQDEAESPMEVAGVDWRLDDLDGEVDGAEGADQDCDQDQVLSLWSHHGVLS